jgi:hypothetical protein
MNTGYSRRSIKTIHVGRGAAVAALLCIAAASGQELQLRPGQFLYAGAAMLDVGDYAVPCVADWNGDGRKDLLVGYQGASKIALFLNTGSDASPAFTTSVNLQAGGADIYLPSPGNCGAPAPFVCDYDHDGKRDLLGGSGADGCVYFYRNTNTDANPILDTGARLTVGSNPLSVTSRATPYVYDWDGDGLNDLLSGNGDGYIFFFKNIGTTASPAYAAGTRIQAGGADLNLGIRSVVRMFDWNGNGVKDLVGSSQTGVYWCKNIGTATSPVLQAPVALRAPINGMGLTAINVGSRMRLDLADWNNDGVMDLLVGNSTGNISYFQGYRFCFTSIAAPAVGQCALEWNSAPYLSYHVLAGPTLNTVTNVVATNLPSAGTITCWTNVASALARFYRLQVAQ